MAETRDNSGALFKNDRKEKDTHPDYTGRGMFQGQEFYINAWLKDGARGKFFSFSFKPIEGQRTQKTEPAKSDIPDDVPF